MMHEQMISTERQKPWEEKPNRNSGKKEFNT